MGDLMSNENTKWWENRVLRSVDNLKLWNENPRLDPSSKLVTVRDYAEELISDPSDKQNFIILLKSIAKRGFVSFDPVVVWKDDDERFAVAEGNRRVTALKLLRSPEKAPMPIRKLVVSLARQIDRDDIEKIKVSLAPSFEDARWYILQRHSTATNQIRWQRLQQQRFIINVYDSVGQDLEETIAITGFKRAAILDSLRYVKIRDMATRPGVTAHLTEDEKEKVYSHRINMTVIERWFGNSQVREAWHIKFSDSEVNIDANLSSFYKAYAEFLKLTFSKDNELGYSVNTRTIDSKFQEIFEYLPKVKPKGEEEEDEAPVADEQEKSDNDKESEQQQSDDEKPDKKDRLKGNPKRGQFTDKYHTINSKSYKLNALFDELGRLPVKRYSNVAAASLRIFLELSVDDFIKSNDFTGEVARRLKKGYHEVTLQQKLNVLRGEFIDDREANKVIGQLLNNSNDYSLNTLNEYIHGTKVHKVEPQFLNRFWDMLSPLLEVLVELREI
ncbi:hypothetical protein AFK76_11860 [Idiomarina zobellii]|uniref:ParB/Sulfiredoxin domain-containing protein n=2 Tax=Idiomarina zobellii TaxID=86103 RepID=A0A837NET3_9GAMM|nr:hypothetical protein AFK76_11860 [Idiomarina zobellii]